MHQYLKRILVPICMLLGSYAFSQETQLTIVTDPWPPYVMNEDNKVEGSDVDITRAVFNKMDISVNIEVMPWKRCIELVKQKKSRWHISG